MDADKKTIPVATTTTKPSPFTFKNFFKCVYIALGLLCIALFLEIIIAGIILRMPLKIVLMFAIFLICSTLIPRRCQKYSHILLLLVLTSITVWTLSPDNDTSWQVSRFDDNFSLQNVQSITPGQNAADIYQLLLDEYDGLTYHPNISDFIDVGLGFTSIFSSYDYPELSAMIEAKKDVIERLLSASRFDRCAFATPVDMNDIKVQLRRIAVMKIWARLLLNSANNDLGDGKIDVALAKQFAVLKMADHLYQQRTMYDNSGAIYIELMAYENINLFIMHHCEAPEYLDLVASQIDLHDEYYPDNWPYIYDSMKLILKNTVGLLYETHPDGRTRRSHNIAPTLNHHFAAKMKINTYQMSVVKAGAVGHWFILPATAEKAGEVIDQAFEEYSPITNPESLERGKPEFQLNYKYVCRQCAHYAAKFYYAIQTQSKRHCNAARSTRILIGLKLSYLENGVWPLALSDVDAIPQAALTDSVNDLEFVYKTTEDSFVLYSIGRNKRDDGSYSMPRFGYDDIRYWPEDIEDVQ